MGIMEVIKDRAKRKLGVNDAAHDYFHAERVANLAEAIREHHGGDAPVISAASYLHDWCSSGGREYHVSEQALSEVRDELVTINFFPTKVEPVIEAIRHHEDYEFNGKQPLSLECLILQDADRLDALGAIGIARCFYTNSLLGYPLGTPQDMHALVEPYTQSQLTSAIQHFYTKLLKLKDAMNTEYAKQFAEGRHSFLVEFLKRFKLEWNGEI